MNKQRFLAGLPLAALISFNLYAQSPAMDEFNQFYKSGQYAKAILALKKIDLDEKNKGEKFYLLGQCFSKLQEFDKAITNYEMALKEGNQHEDLYYQYGQALYASNDLKKARSAFTESAKRSYNTPASTYYVAHISQILEEYALAKESYTALLKDKNADNKIKQISNYQLGETLLALMREKNNKQDALEKGVAKYVLPLMKRAFTADKTSAVAADIKQRISELEKEFNLDPNLLLNGRKISPKRYSAYLLQKIKYDDNITLTNEENNVTQSKKESFIFESEAFGKYDFVFTKRFIISPEIRINFVQNSDQDSPEVFQNDTYSLNFNLKNKYEHTMFMAPASMLLDVEYSRNYKAWQQKHKREHYADAMSFGIGELFSFFSFGDTSIKLRFKDYKGENTTISNRTKSLSADQTFILPTQHLLIAFFEANFIDNYNNPTTNTNSYLGRFDYIIPEILPTYTLDFALAMTVTDTKEQKASRGTEFTLNPSLDLSKQISERFKIAVNYDFTKSNSKHTDYKYTKSIFSTEFRYSF